MTISKFIILLSSLLIFSVANANDLAPLSVYHSQNAIGKHIAVLTESGHPLTIDQVRKAYAEKQFISDNTPVLSFGIGSSPRWLSFSVSNNTLKQVLQRLVIESSWLDKIDIFVIHNNQLVAKQQMGDSYPFYDRPVEHRFFVLDHDYDPGLSRLFIRVETPDPFVLPIFFGNQKEAIQKDIFNGYSYGFFYGTIIALLFYNLILYLKIGQPRYLYYVIFMTISFAANFTYTGHSYYWLWPNSVNLQRWGNPLLIMAYATGGIAFTLSFLNTRSNFPKIFHKTRLFCLVMWIAQGIFLLFHYQTQALSLALCFVIIFAVFTLILTLFNLQKGYPETKYFLIASLSTLIGSVITSLSVWNVIPYTEVLYRAVEIGSSIDIILLSIALAEQFRTIQQEKNIAEVLARLDPLTRLCNRRAFYELTSPFISNAERHNKDFAIIMLDIDKFKLINDSFGHGNGDEVIKKVAKTIHHVTRKGDISARWGGEEFVIFLPETDLPPAIQLAERLRQIISTIELKTDSGIINFTISLGIAKRTAQINSIDNVIKSADAQLYLAKQSGRNKVSG